MMCTDEESVQGASAAYSVVQIPRELKDTWHEVIIRSFQLLSSVYGGNDMQQRFNRLQLLSPAVVLWDKFRFDRKFINSWKQQFIEALNEEVVVRKDPISSSGKELYILRNLSDIPLSRAHTISNQNSHEPDLIENMEVAERTQEASELAILKKRSRSSLQDSPGQEDYTYEEVIDLLPPMYKKPVTEQVTLSCTTIGKAPLLHLEQDGLTVRGEKGYRSIRATHGVFEGDWYFEVLILPGDEGNVRIGWCTIQADMEAPIGYDKYGYSIRDKTGELFHEQRLIPFGEAFGEGDTIGCFLHLPTTKHNMGEIWEDFERKWIAWLLYFSSPRRPNWHQQEIWKPKQPQIEQVNEGYMEFYKNGKLMGSTVQGVELRKWYPAVALYKNAKVTCNFGPHFQYPNIGHGYKPISSAISPM